jgi:hypothetical protein
MISWLRNDLQVLERFVNVADRLYSIRVVYGEHVNK